jgi:hypothetical protein
MGRRSPGWVGPLCPLANTSKMTPDITHSPHALDCCRQREDTMVRAWIVSDAPEKVRNMSTQQK